MKKTSASLTYRSYLIPFILITTLFFLWGFARAILDVLNKHFQDELNISITSSAMIQVMTYLAYFIMAIPAGGIINRFGYRRGVVFGLLLFSIGSFLFVPSTWLPSDMVFSAFLGSLFILACGLAFLETAANPYSTELGPVETATSRLNLSQTFNGLGSCLAPALVGGYLFTGGDITTPYIILGAVVMGIAGLFCFVKLPEIPHMEEYGEEGLHARERFGKLWHHKMFLFGLAALLTYEVAEISINSYFINFTTMPHTIDGTIRPGLMSPTTAAIWLSGALLLFMIGRAVGSVIMTFVKAEKVLLISAVMSAACMGVIFLGPGKMAIYALMANYFFESIMFPTIFSLALRGMGSLTKTASSVLMMTPIGGCFFLLTGFIAEKHMLLPFVIPMIGYIIIFLFAYALVCRKGVANEV